ncbi:MAG: DUF6880 family protein [Bradymonadia bacterium]
MMHTSPSALLRALQGQLQGDAPLAWPELLEQLSALPEHVGDQTAQQTYETAIGAVALQVQARPDTGAQHIDGLLGLFEQWLYARQRLGALAEDTLAIIGRWQSGPIADFTLQLTRHLLPAFDEAGLDALQQRMHQQLAIAPPIVEGTPRPLRIGPHWAAAETLLLIHLRRGDALAYAALARRLGITSDDCAHLARLHREGGDLRVALQWVDEGLALAQQTLSASSPTHGVLKTLQRVTLIDLGRWSEAVDIIWGDYDHQPTLDLYVALMSSLPVEERRRWRRRALTRARRDDLGVFIEIGLHAEALDALAAAVVEAGPDVIARLSHHVTEPVAVALSPEHPSAAALIYRALALRILDADRSAWYDAAVDHLRDARRCYLKADQAGVWSALVDYIRRAHGQKHPFMASFRAVLHGDPQADDTPFLDRAHDIWRQISGT